MTTYENAGNDSGSGLLAKLPAELEGWNWGAFLMTLWWSLSHKAWLGLLVLLGAVPRIGWFAALVVHIVFGINGNLWAWQNRRWDDIEHFKATQRIWMWWGAAAISVLIACTLLLLVAASNARQAQIDSMRPQFSIQSTDPATGKKYMRPATEEERRSFEAQTGQNLDR